MNSQPRMDDPMSERAETTKAGGQRQGRPGAKAWVAWTGATVLVVTLALILQTTRLHRRDADLDRREKSLADMKALVTQLQKSNNEREKRLHEVADNLEEMYRLMRSRVSDQAPPADPGLRRVGYSRGEPVPVPDLAPAGK